LLVDKYLKNVCFDDKIIARKCVEAVFSRLYGLFRERYVGESILSSIGLKFQAVEYLWGCSLKD